MKGVVMPTVYVVVNKSFESKLRTAFYCDVRRMIADQFDCLTDIVEVKTEALAPGCSTGQPTISITVMARDNLPKFASPHAVVSDIAVRMKTIASEHGVISERIRVTLRLTPTFIASVG